jgi:hypothetical protein
MGARFELEQDREADRGRMHRRHDDGGPRSSRANLAAPSPSASRSSEAGVLSLADRFAAIQEVGRQIASALSEVSIFAAVNEGSLRFVRGA